MRQQARGRLANPMHAVTAAGASPALVHLEASLAGLSASPVVAGQGDGLLVARRRLMSHGAADE